MFWTIVLAFLFIAFGLPIIFRILFNEFTIEFFPKFIRSSFNFLSLLVSPLLSIAGLLAIFTRADTFGEKFLAFSQFVFWALVFVWLYKRHLSSKKLT